MPSKEPRLFILLSGIQRCAMVNLCGGFVIFTCWKAVGKVFPFGNYREINWLALLLFSRI